MSLKDSIDNLKFDVRMLDFNVKNGSLSEAELTSYLSNLSDTVEKSEPVRLGEVDADVFEEELVETAPETPGFSNGGFGNGPY